MAEEQLTLYDAATFSLFYESCHLIVYRYIYGMTGGPVQEVEDLTAETFFKAWKKRNRFQGNQGAAVGWLLTIARNLVFDAHRRRKSHPVDDVDLNWDDHFSSTQLSPETHFEDREEFLILWRLVQKLPADLREMLVLRYMLGWQVKAIAKQTHMTENNISVSLYRTIKKIQQNWPDK